MIEEGKLDQEWAANSYLREHLDVVGERHRVVFDPRLRNVVAPHILRFSRDHSNTHGKLVQGIKRARRFLRR